MSIFIITGLSGSGKTTISSEVSQRLGTPRVDIHSIITNKARGEGFERGRDWIFSIGVSSALAFTRQKTVDELRESLEHYDSAILDEVLDMKTLSTIEEEFPEQEIMIIHIKTGSEKRTVFVGERIEGDESSAQREIDFIDSNKRLVGIDAIIAKANVVVENDGTLEMAIEKLSEVTIGSSLKTPEGQIRRRERME